MGWIRIRMDPELLPGSGTRKIQSWIRILNKSFRIHNTAHNCIKLSFLSVTCNVEYPKCFNSVSEILHFILIRSRIEILPNFIDNFWVIGTFLI